jgi:hypothetical protein
MIDDGDTLYIKTCAGDLDVGQSGWWDINMRPLYLSLPGKKPYLINLTQVECMVGEWNKDKTQYGVRIFYASGNSVWIGESAAKKIFGLMEVYGENAEAVFDRAKKEG